FPVRFRVESAEGSSFGSPQTIAEQSSVDFKNTGDNPVSFPANHQPARIVRVTATKLWERTSDYVFALAELQVIVDGTNAALGTTVSALYAIEEGRWAKKFLVDGFDSRHKLGRANSEVKTRLEAEMRARNEKRQRLVEAVTDEATRSELAEIKDRLNEIS